MTYIYGGHHNTTSRENLNQMFSGEALQGLSNRGMTNTNAIAEHGLRHHATWRKLKSHDHLFDAPIGFFIE